ncbi:MAG: hypothetical protein SFZ23_01935 [Planctomycetota bacterium]|nr:hypothetical protein [Planctomycetota bacterium]
MASVRLAACMSRVIRSLVGASSLIGGTVGFVGVVALPQTASAQMVVERGGGPGGPMGNWFRLFSGGGGGMGMMMGGGGGDSLTAPVTSKHLEQATSQLALTKDQQAAINDIFAGFQEEFQLQAAALREEMDKARADFRENQDWTVFRAAGEKARQFGITRDEMEKTFWTDVQTVLTDEQKPAWATFERGLRREQGMSRGLLSGESVDLVTLVREMELSPESRAKVQPLLEQYEADLDRELQARKAAHEEVTSAAQKLLEGSNFMAMAQDEAKQAEADKLIEKARSASLRVRDLQRRFARQIEGELPENARSAFSAEINKQAHPRIYRPTRAARMMDAALGFNDVTPDQRTQIADLRGSYERDLGTLSKDMVAETEKMETTFSMASVSGMMRGGWEQSAMAGLMRRRGDLNRGVEAKLKAILTPDQIERLPSDEEGERGERGERRRMRDRDGEGEGEGGRRGGLRRQT